MTDLLERLDKLITSGWDDTGAPYCLGEEHHQAFCDSASTIRSLSKALQDISDLDYESHPMVLIAVTALNSVQGVQE